MSDKEKKKLPLSALYRRYGIFIILLLMIIVSSFINQIFLTRANMINVVRQLAVVMIIACGAQFVMICGMIDLSPGAVLALAGCIGCAVYVQTQSVFLAVLASVGVGITVGLVMGFVITQFNLLPFIMTLAMMNIARGLALIFTDGKPINDIGSLAVIGQGYIGPIPIPIIIMLVCVVLVWLVLTKTKFGRYTYAVGGNEHAAEACGINVKLIKLKSYIIDGALVGLSGIVLMSRINSGQPAMGEGYEFDAITAIIVGGTSMTGGAGSIWGTLVGGLIVSIINNILNLQNVSTYYQQVIKGIIIAVAVLIDVSTKAPAKRKRSFAGNGTSEKAQ